MEDLRDAEYHEFWSRDALDERHGVSQRGRRGTLVGFLVLAIVLLAALVAWRLLV